MEVNISLVEARYSGGKAFKAEGVNQQEHLKSGLPRMKRRFRGRIHSRNHGPRIGRRNWKVEYCGGLVGLMRVGYELRSALSELTANLVLRWSVKRCDIISKTPTGSSVITGDAPFLLMSHLLSRHTKFMHTHHPHHLFAPGYHLAHQSLLIDTLSALSV